ncbi:hypothetical protein [Leuconostoc rapi]|uniref:DUF7671 family protein n=1 Tax=Leuconostoc rapi TaxID=1406906 RepID=UPI001958D825|nr:hypothetical protein [Leuconostoc rapi]MBM7435630.1 hypothetical protein [Leuconostoc rapi]
MGDSKKYIVHVFTGVVLNQDLSGQYVPRAESLPHVWRTGKHTKGQFKKIGQIFITETGQAVAVIGIEKLKFSQRHDYVPLQRWTNLYIEPEKLQLWA